MSAERPKYGYAPKAELVQPVDDRVDPSTWFGKRAAEVCAPISPLGRRALRFHLKSQSAGPTEIERMES